MNKVSLISSLILFLFSLSVYSQEGEHLINSRSSIYDSNDNLIVDLKKGDRVCLCNKPNHSDTKFSTYSSVCDLNNNVIGSIYGGHYSGGNIGRKISNKCSAPYQILDIAKKLSKNINEELVNINNETSIKKKNIKYNKFLKKLDVVSSLEFKKNYVEKLFFNKLIWQLTEYDEESFNQHAYAKYFSKHGNYLEFFVKKNKNNLIEYGTFEGKWFAVNSDTIRVEVDNGYFKYHDKDEIVKESYSWWYLLKIYEKDSTRFFSTRYEDSFNYEGAQIVATSLKYQDFTYQLDSLNTLLNFVKKYSESKDSSFNIFDVSTKFAKDNNKKKKENQNIQLANNGFHCMTGVIDESKTLRRIYYLKEGNDYCSPGIKEKESFQQIAAGNGLDFYCFGPMLGMENVKYFFKVESQLKSNIICNSSAQRVYFNFTDSDSNQIVTNNSKVETKSIEDKVQNIQVAEDTSSPKIIVSEEFESNSQLMAEISGSINDESEIASLTIDGYEISLNNSNFKKEFFVKPKGQDVEIVAIDIHGNKSSKIVSLKRQKVVIQQVKLDSLNPTKIQSDISTNKAALIIGVENYKNTFSALYAENDALYFNDFANTTLGVPKENIKLLTNDEADQNNTIKALIKWLPKIVEEDKTEIYLFFSGHGLASPDGEDLFLLPSDGDPEILEYSSLMRNEIFNNIAKLNPKSVTVFLDTCYSGETRSDDMLIASAKPIFIEAKEQDIPFNFNIFSASSNNEIATIYDEAEHGLFSYYMMKGLEGDADVNSDNQITNGELLTFIKKNVSRQANQTPQLSGDPEQVLVQW